MKKKLCLFAVTLIAVCCLSLSGVFAATYSKTKTKSVSYESYCTGVITDKATLNTSGMNWSFSLSGRTGSGQAGFTFGIPYSKGVDYSADKSTAEHNIGYGFLAPSQSSVGGGSTKITFGYNNGKIL